MLEIIVESDEEFKVWLWQVLEGISVGMEKILHETAPLRRDRIITDFCWFEVGKILQKHINVDPN